LIALFEFFYCQGVFTFLWRWTRVTRVPYIMAHSSAESRLERIMATLLLRNEMHMLFLRTEA
jgi:hypothetical protein